MILSQTCETKLRYGHQSTNALPAFSTGLPHELYVKKPTTHSRFLRDPRLYPRLPNSAATGCSAAFQGDSETMRRVSGPISIWRVRDIFSTAASL